VFRRGELCGRRSGKRRFVFRRSVAWAFLTKSASNLHYLATRIPFDGSLSLFCRGSRYHQITGRVYYYANYTRIELITIIDTVQHAITVIMINVGRRSRRRAISRRSKHFHCRCETSATSGALRYARGGMAEKQAASRRDNRKFTMKHGIDNYTADFHIYAHPSS